MALPPEHRTPRMEALEAIMWEATSVAYGGEAVDARHSDKATTNDGVLTVDAANGTITLKPTITNPA
jgi:hypothetical protein